MHPMRPMHHIYRASVCGGENISDKWCACWCWELLLSSIIIITIIIVCIYLFGGPLWPYTYAPALAKKLVSER